MGKGYRKLTFYEKASGEPDALKGASPVRFHGKLEVRVLSPLFFREAPGSLRPRCFDSIGES